MKIAIYSRGVEFDQQKEVQQLFDELAKENIEPVIWQPVLDTIKSRLKFLQSFLLSAIQKSWMNQSISS